MSVSDGRSEYMFVSVYRDEKCRADTARSRSGGITLHATVAYNCGKGTPCWKNEPEVKLKDPS